MTRRLPAGLLCLALLPAASAPQERADLAIVDARVLDVDTGAVAEGRTVLISDGRITAVREDLV